MSNRLRDLVQLARPTQWIKNGFVWVGWVFGAHAHDAALFQTVLAATLAFCLASSAVYIFNDFMDRERDREHPTKRHRPLASGAVSAPAALSLAALCVVGGFAAAWLASPRVAYLLAIYLAINLAYSVALKHEPVLDVFCIATGFMLRILAGTWALQIPPSGWLILTGMFLTLFLGFAKRRAEWTEQAGKGAHSRRVLVAYSQSLLDTFLAITATGTVLSYGLYTLDPKTVALHHTDKLIYTLPFVLFGLFRYLFLLHNRNRGENPAVDVFTDWQTIVSTATFALSAVWLIQR